MEYFLIFLTAILFLIVIFSLFNEKITKLPNEIALLLFSLIVGIILSALSYKNMLVPSTNIMHILDTYSLDKILLEVLLCFMLFTGASELKLPELVDNFKPICLLALLTTVITSVLYGLVFWGITALLGMNISFTLCVLLGSIVSPTDPIAATGILNKLGLSNDVTAIMEGESLFNDGTGVALFIFLKELYEDTKDSNFFIVMFRELAGALLVGFAISFIFFMLIKATKDPIKHIIISMLSVTLAYCICEEFGFSGVIASVICGIYYSTKMDQYKAANTDIDPRDYYKDFWKIIDTLLNYILYVLIGVSFVFVSGTEHLIIIGLAAILFNIGARFLGVMASTAICKQLPDGYHIKPFSILMTWGGLKGGLCLALAMSTKSFLPVSIYNFILYVTYITIIFTTLIQGLTVGKLYNWIKEKWAIK